MKRNFNILLLAIFIAIASCSFTTKTFENPNKGQTTDAINKLFA
jgi:carboxyl-terminal processing protease